MMEVVNSTVIYCKHFVIVTMYSHNNYHNMIIKSFLKIKKN
jgi:hypothetical protein